MIHLVERLVRDARWRVSRSRWLAGLHDAAGAPAAPSDEPGLLIVQIDGLSGARLRAALDRNAMPFVRRLVWAGELEARPVYSGIPSTTPAVQAELFYGVEQAVPAFTFIDRETRRLLRMYQADAAGTVEARVAARSVRSLLEGGAAFADVFTGGADDARFCMASFGARDALPRRLRRSTPAVLLAYLPAVVRIAGLALGELLGAPRDLVRGLRAGEDTGSELKFLVSRVAVGVVLRELVALGMAVDLARGRPVVHGNFIGYDENAHRRGPDSALAEGALPGIDAAIARVWRAAQRSPARAYDVWIVSDHGQEASESYVHRRGETVADAVARLVRELGADSTGGHRSSRLPAYGIGTQRTRQLGERLIARVVPGLDVTDVAHEPGTLAVAAQGPLGHVYLPARLEEPDLDRLAAAVVERAEVPMVLRAGAAGAGAVVHTPDGTRTLPADAVAVLGADHPYRDEVAADLVALTRHPDAGDLVLCGWRADGTSVSFPFENGSHAGPGQHETDAFALVPPDTPLPRTGVLRPRDLRQAAFDVLAGAAPGAPERRRHGVRILTYNVHSCIGLDGKLSPRRIARVIARHHPDVVALQELDVGRGRTGGVDQARLLAEMLEMELSFHPTISVAEERYGDAVLSPHPLRVVRSGILPGIGLEPRGALWVEIDVPDDVGGTHPLQVIVTHLSLHPRERILAARALAGPEWLGAAGDDVVLCGDLNALSWFPSCAVLRRRLVDAQRGLDGHRPQRTWFGRFPLGRIDHVLVDPAWTVLDVQVPDDVLARVASDHRPLVVDAAPRWAVSPPAPAEVPVP